MTAARADVVAASQAAFPQGDVARILALLDLYGAAPYERERERVQLAILALSKGDEDQLRHYVQQAKIDYRDILSWIETGPLSGAQAQAYRRAVDELLAKWGRK